MIHQIISQRHQEEIDKTGISKASVDLKHGRKYGTKTVPHNRKGTIDGKGKFHKRTTIMSYNT